MTHFPSYWHQPASAPSTNSWGFSLCLFLKPNSLKSTHPKKLTYFTSYDRKTNQGGKKTRENYLSLENKAQYF